jgi:hypothetical protein
VSVVAAGFHDIQCERGRDHPASVLELAPNSMPEWALETRQEANSGTASPARINVLQRVDMDEVAQVAADHDAVTTSRHEWLQVCNRSSVRVGDFEYQLHGLMLRRRTGGLSLT